MTVKVDGAKQLRRIAKKVSKEESKEALKRGHKEAAEVVSNKAKALVPVESGALKRSIRPLGSQAAAKVRAGNGTNVPYAGVVHYGNPHVRTKSNPFLTKAVAKKYPEVRRIIEGLYRDLAKKLATTRR